MNGGGAKFALMRFSRANAAPVFSTWSWITRSRDSSSAPVRASTLASQRSPSDAASISVCHASRRRPSAFGCQPSSALIGEAEIPPPLRVALRPLASVTRRPDGSSSPSSRAAASTASAALSVAVVAPALSPRTRSPPAKMTFPARSTLTVIWLLKTS
jgi:hypothetical protein